MVNAKGEPPLAAEERSVLEAVDVDPTSTAAILSRTGRSLESVSMSLELLAEEGLVRDFGGAWGRVPAGRESR